MMKGRHCIGRALAWALLICLTAGMLAGCGEKKAAGELAGYEEKHDNGKSENRLKIVCTIFPQYDWTKQILGDLADETDLILLMKNGADMHSYQPTVWDMAAVSDADLFIYVGGTSDFWVEAALNNAKNPDMKALDLLEALEDDLLEEEHVEGMQAERGHDHGENADGDAAGEHGAESGEEADDHGEESGEDHGHELEYDEHIWLSLKNAVRSCEAITDALCELDVENKVQYEKNEKAYVSQLQALDREYQMVSDRAKCPVLLFGDRFPFRYLTEDYGLTYYAAFAGCSAETEASFGTITYLANKADELKLPVVFAIDGSDQRIAQTIAGNTRSDHVPAVRMLDSMQSVSEEDIKNGENYLSVMERNLEVLKEALPGIGE